MMEEINVVEKGNSLEDGNNEKLPTVSVSEIMKDTSEIQTALNASAFTNTDIVEKKKVNVLVADSLSENSSDYESAASTKSSSTHSVDELHLHDSLLVKPLSPTLLSNALRTVKNFFSPEKSRSKPVLSSTPTLGLNDGTIAPSISPDLPTSTDSSSEMNETSGSEAEKMSVSKNNSSTITESHNRKSSDLNVSALSAKLSSLGLDAHNDTDDSYTTTVSRIDDSFQSTVTHIDDYGQFKLDFGGDSTVILNHNFNESHENTLENSLSKDISFLANNTSGKESSFLDDENEGIIPNISIEILEDPIVVAFPKQSLDPVGPMESFPQDNNESAVEASKLETETQIILETQSKENLESHDSDIIKSDTEGNLTAQKRLLMACESNAGMKEECESKELYSEQTVNDSVVVLEDLEVECKDEKVEKPSEPTAVDKEECENISNLESNFDISVHVETSNNIESRSLNESGIQCGNVHDVSKTEQNSILDESHSKGDCPQNLVSTTIAASRIDNSFQSTVTHKDDNGEFRLDFGGDTTVILNHNFNESYENILENSLAKDISILANNTSGKESNLESSCLKNEIEGIITDNKIEILKDPIVIAYPRQSPDPVTVKESFPQENNESAVEASKLETETEKQTILETQSKENPESHDSDIIKSDIEGNLTAQKRLLMACESNAGMKEECESKELYSEQTVNDSSVLLEDLEVEGKDEKFEKASEPTVGAKEECENISNLESSFDILVNVQTPNKIESQYLNESGIQCGNVHDVSKTEQNSILDESHSKGDCPQNLVSTTIAASRIDNSFQSTVTGKDDNGEFRLDFVGDSTVILNHNFNESYENILENSLTKDISILANNNSGKESNLEPPCLKNENDGVITDNKIEILEDPIVIAFPKQSLDPVGAMESFPQDNTESAVEASKLETESQIILETQSTENSESHDSDIIKSDTEGNLTAQKRLLMACESNAGMKEECESKELYSEQTVNDSVVVLEDIRVECKDEKVEKPSEPTVRDREELENISKGDCPQNLVSTTTTTTSSASRIDDSFHSTVTHKDDNGEFRLNFGRDSTVILNHNFNESHENILKNSLSKDISFLANSTSGKECNPESSCLNDENEGIIPNKDEKLEKPIESTVGGQEECENIPNLKSSFDISVNVETSNNIESRSLNESGIQCGNVHDVSKTEQNSILDESHSKGDCPQNLVSTTTTTPASSIDNSFQSTVTHKDDNGEFRLDFGGDTTVILNHNFNESHENILENSSSKDISFLADSTSGKECNSESSCLNNENEVIIRNKDEKLEKPSEPTVGGKEECENISNLKSSFDISVNVETSKKIQSRSLNESGIQYGKVNDLSNTERNSVLDESHPKGDCSQNLVPTSDQISSDFEAVLGSLKELKIHDSSHADELSDAKEPLVISNEPYMDHPTNEERDLSYVRTDESFNESSSNRTVEIVNATISKGDFEMNKSEVNTFTKLEVEQPSTSTPEIPKHVLFKELLSGYSQDLIIKSTEKHNSLISDRSYFEKMSEDISPIISETTSPEQSSVASLIEKNKQIDYKAPNNSLSPILELSSECVSKKSGLSDCTSSDISKGSPEDLMSVCQDAQSLSKDSRTVDNARKPAEEISFKSLDESMRKQSDVYTAVENNRVLTEYDNVTAMNLQNMGTLTSRQGTGIRDDKENYKIEAIPKANRNSSLKNDKFSGTILSESVGKGDNFKMDDIVCGINKLKLDESLKLIEHEEKENINMLLLPQGGKFKSDLLIENIDQAFFSDDKPNNSLKGDKGESEVELAAFIQQQFTAADIEKICSVVEDPAVVNLNRHILRASQEFEKSFHESNFEKPLSNIDEFLNIRTGSSLTEQSLDFLDSIQGRHTGRDLSRESLYVKFDPLVEPPKEYKGLMDFAKNEIEQSVTQNPKEQLIDFPPKQLINIVTPLTPPCSTKSEPKPPEVNTAKIQEMQQEVERLKGLYKEREAKNKKALDNYENQIAKLMGQSCVLEDKLKASEEREKSFVRKLKEQNENISQLRVCMEEYINVVSILTTELENVRQANKSEIASLKSERDSYMTHLQNSEAAFTDVHSKYEKSKKVIESYKKNEAAFRSTLSEQTQKLDEYHEKLKTVQEKAAREKARMEQDIEEMKGQHLQDISRARAQLRKAELKLQGVQELLDQKVKENQELTVICDDLIAGKK